ncbi:hypothetical protein [Nocardioides sp. SYSU D00038]|uniref:hypothetical protein n=1 Tax=Nocardioides sp. SYSU D00038 TaxID=2812554 RepID=UPI001967292B|nr:hypothetical protein [Nocardioides sp. SYSU D00038]
MSSTPVAPEGVESGRRVRHQARDAAVVMAFSLASSGALALALLLISRLGQQG